MQQDAAQYYAPYGCRPEEDIQWCYGDPRPEYLPTLYPAPMFSYTTEPRIISDKGTGRVKFHEPEENKVKYKIALENILNRRDSRTTLMIKNIPNKYNQRLLLQKIDEGFKGQYDFFYLPIDFKVSLKANSVEQLQRGIRFH